MGDHDPSAPDPGRPTFDEAFVRGGVHEPSAAERAIDLGQARHRRRRDRRRAPTAPRAQGLRAWLRPLAPALLLLVAFAGLAWLQRPDGAHGARGGFVVSADRGDRPTPVPAESDEPLGIPSPGTLSDSYRFLSTQPDGTTPVAYDPCRAIHVVINGRTVPVGAERVVHEALEEMSAITGLQFHYEGEVAEVPSADRDPYLPDRYGDRWAPVLIAWTDPTEVPELDGDIAGIGGSAALEVGRDGTRVYVSGMVALDGPSFNRFMSYPNGSELARAVVLHELGHLLGLDHVDDPTQLMYEDNIGTTAAQAGDRAGLVRLGQGVCVPEL